jgi:hypothetical protein
MGAGYALWVTLDSLNHTGNLSENDHYRGAFAVFPGFASISHGKNAGSFQFYRTGNPQRRVLRVQFATELQ